MFGSRKWTKKVMKKPVGVSDSALGGGTLKRAKYFQDWLKPSARGTKYRHRTAEMVSAEPRIWWHRVGRLSREAFEGGEFDWFAVDAAGHIGHFSTAGFGPVPLPVLVRLDAPKLDELWSLGEGMLRLPVVGEATGHLPGRIDDWLGMARRGLFSYDWQHWSGPYQRAATPSVPVRVTALPAHLSEVVRLVEWPSIRFAELQSVRPEELCPCR
jgi:hypothetical protein